MLLELHAKTGETVYIKPDNWLLKGIDTVSVSVAVPRPEDYIEVKESFEEIQAMLKEGGICAS